MTQGLDHDGFKMDRMYALNRTIGELTRGLKIDKAKQRGSKPVLIKLDASDNPRKHARVMGQNWRSTVGSSKSAPYPK